MKVQFMKSFRVTVNLVMIVFGIASAESVALSRDLVVTSFGENSLAYDIPVEIFQVNSAHGELQDQEFFARRVAGMRSGCSLRSPWIQAGAMDRSLKIIPRMGLRWWGVYGEDNMFEYDVLEIRVYKRQNGQDSIQKRFIVHTGMLRERWIATYPNGGNYLRAEFKSRIGTNFASPDSSQALIFESVDLPEDGEFQVALCNIAESTEVRFDSFVVITDPN